MGLRPTIGKEEVKRVNIATTTSEMHSRVKRLEEMLPYLVPPRDTWSPVDEALYGPVDFYRVPLDQAQAMQFKAIKYAFWRHYSLNKSYHKYCQGENISPDDIRTVDDLNKIPLILDRAFKQYPSGKNFAYWLATVFTGELPGITIKSPDPTFEEVISAFKATGIDILHSSGTSGQMTVIPKDVKTANRARYAYIKGCVNLYDFFIDRALLCLPNPKKVNAAIGLGVDIIAKVARNAHFLLDFDMSARTAHRAVTGNQKREGASGPSPQGDIQQQTIARIVQCLERLSKTEETFVLFGAPFMFLAMMNKLQKEGQSFDFGERGLVATGGGWRINEDARIPLGDFRKQVQDVLGIPETHCFDGYGSTELNEVFLECPEGHYRHLPLTHLKPFVLDKDLTPMDYGEQGRFAFLDALANSYPGFIISGDEVRMLEHCPVCDRLGPVLEPEIHRAKGEEERGCAETVWRSIVSAFAPDEESTE
jgi:hypothetical protein